MASMATNFGRCGSNIPLPTNEASTLRLNFGRKGGKEVGCITDESCLEQGVSRTNGCLELSRFSLESGDWYVRQKPLLSPIL